MYRIDLNACKQGDIGKRQHVPLELPGAIGPGPGDDGGARHRDEKRDRAHPVI